MHAFAAVRQNGTVVTWGQEGRWQPDLRVMRPFAKEYALDFRPWGVKGNLSFQHISDLFDLGLSDLIFNESALKRRSLIETDRFIADSLPIPRKEGHIL